ncbi:hypothetical protein MF672_006205 [Actinomadura sp. ATCC 31491]|uniref:Uncharacterized protein n=1 Tax=Actinomadura luzonensis TaxID=2805427 RepID=A0ABT0FM30_9ACTN|nr:hypothetical protein [Actinomadura luzonensis]MCK2213387.1 hypothetical protein [Actinomadura luzonensis]
MSVAASGQRQDPAEADNFRTIVTIALEAAQRGEPHLTMTGMTRKITEALDAA